MKTPRALFILLLLCLVSYAGYNAVFPAASRSIEIPRGSSDADTARLLKDNGFIASKNVFLILARITGSSKKIRSGTYSFSGRATVFGILRALVSGKSQLIRFTVPEGFTCEQIAELLKANELGNPEKFLEIVKKDNLEGYLFPETYFFNRNTGEQKVIAKLNGEFNLRYKPEYSAAAKRLNMSKGEVVILASIIEKEAKTDEDRRIIAAVFHNRLKKGWMLESCATIRYALKINDRKLLYKDLNVKSKYNTYRNRGLPPGPICNPGIKSIEAVLNPDLGAKDMMFFFVSGEGTHQFSKYYSQHIEAQKHLKAKENKK